MKITEDTILSIITEGATGVGELAFCSSSLSSILGPKLRQAGQDIPHTTALNRLYSKLGYSQLAKPKKWRGKTRRVWVKAGAPLPNWRITEILDGTLK